MLSLDPAVPSGPDQLVQLNLEADRESVLEDPLGQLRRAQALRCLVRGNDRGEQDGPNLRAVGREHALREVVVVAVLQDELDLVLLPKKRQVRIRLVGLHAGSRALHVHHVPQAASGSPPVQHTFRMPACSAESASSRIRRATSSTVARVNSPPSTACIESHHRHRRLQPYNRTKTVGRPTSELSPWIETYISFRRSSFPFRGLSTAWACMEGYDGCLGA